MINNLTCKLCVCACICWAPWAVMYTSLIPFIIVFLFRVHSLHLIETDGVLFSIESHDTHILSTNLPKYRGS